MVKDFTKVHADDFPKEIAIRAPSVFGIKGYMLEQAGIYAQYLSSLEVWRAGRDMDSDSVNLALSAVHQMTRSVYYGTLTDVMVSGTHTFLRGVLNSSGSIQDSQLDTLFNII